MIYTSYFSNLKRIPKDWITVSIAAYNPTWYDGMSYTTLAPHRDLLYRYKNGQVTEEEYTNEFKQKLALLNKVASLEYLNSLGKNVVLLCYERPEGFCHRHIVAEWLGIEEYSNYKGSEKGNEN